MKGYIRQASVFILLVSISFLFLDCRNPLTQIGLGDKIDLDTPDLSITSHSNGSYVSGDLHLEGTYADDFLDVSVRISLDGGITFVQAGVDSTVRRWYHTFRTTDPEYPLDGDRDVIITVTDSAGKTVEKRTLLYFDNTAPIVLVKVPIGYVYPPNEYNGTVSIRGDAFDQFPIERVQVDVYNSSGTLLASSSGSIGTNSWSYNFPSVGLIGGIENCDVIVTATDRAGNQNATFYHIADVMDFNGGVALSVEEVAALDASSSAFRDIALTALPAELPTEDKLTLRINQGLDLPVFDIYNPDPAGTPEENTLAPSAKAIGMVTDDAEGVDNSTIEIQFDSLGWNPVQTKVGTGLAVRFEQSLSSLTPGPHTLQLRASDNQGAQGYSVEVDFSIDVDAPSIEITSPTQGAYLNSTSFTIEGTASSGGTITDVLVSLDDGATYNPASSTSGDFDTWQFNVVGAPADAVSIKAKAISGSKTAYYNLAVVVDTQFPTVSFLSPTRTSSVNGPVTVRGASSDNRQITKVELCLGKPENWIELSDPYSWEYLFDSAGYANATYADEVPPAGSNIWKFYIYARITDIAGNETTKGDPDDPDDPDNYFIYIDQALDKPRVTVISPAAGTTNVAGPVIISGTALDDDGLHHVEMQIDVNGDGDFADWVDFWSGSAKGADGDTLDRFEREDTWYPVTGTSLWSQQINGYGEMYQTEVGHDGDITVRVRAVDTKDGGLTPGIAGDIQQFALHLDDTIPRIESLNLISGDYVKGVFHITGQALDDEQIGSVQISYDGGINYTNLSSGWYTVNDVDDWSLDITIDTGPSGRNISSGILYLRLKITDNANYQSITSMNLNVDNVYPTDEPDHYTADADDINGTAARVQGTAQDAGTVSGIEEIEVYFVRSGLVYNPKTGATTGVGTFDFGAGSVSYPTGAGSDDYKISINDFNEFGNDAGGNGDGDGLDESLTLAGSTYNWWAEFDSTLIPDGTIEIHYVIFDNSGNGKHYQRTDGFVKNHKPSITGVTVGSDIDHSGTVEPDERFPYTGSFKARSRLYIAITATDDQPIASYQVIRDPGGAEEEVLSAASGTIDITGYSEGTTLFLCGVTDTDDIPAETLLSVTIENNDLVPPVITLASLTQGQLVAGHLEESGASLHDGTDADLSGTIALTGTASDNQRIDSISVQIDAFNAGAGVGAEREVASWTGTELVSTDANFVIDTQSLSESAGHQIGWTYTWNSAAVSNVAANNLAVRFRAYDFAPASDLDSETVDVVPYISGITRTSPTQRSKYGNFMVQQGETNVTINGYNLDDSGTHWIRVHNTAGGDPDLGAWDAVTMPAIASPFTTMNVNLTNVTHSGWLRLMVNGVEAINNINDNSLNTNKEDDGSGLGTTKWTDDRYLRVWEVGDTFDNSGNPEHPSMSIRSNGTLYGAWTNSANAETFYATTTAASRVSIFDKYDPPEYTDFYIDSADNLNIAYLANYYGIGPWGFLSIWNPDAPLQNESTDGWPYNPVYLFEWLGEDDMLYQFQRPRIVRSGNHIHMAYFDMNEKTMKYSYVANGTAQNANENNGSGAFGHLDLDGGEAYPSGGGQSGPLSALAGEYVAIDVDGNGYPVVMYYDISNQTLKLAYSNSTTPTALGNWTIQTVFRSDDPNRTFVGKYVTMKMDSNGDIHAACSRTSTGSLIYLHAPNPGGGSYTFDYSVEVDSEGAVGTWADITLDGTTPYISYLNNSMVGTFDGLKMAYYDTGLGDWEYEIVPISTGIDDKRTNLEYKQGSVNWVVAIGYASSNFDIVYLKPEE